MLLLQLNLPKSKHKSSSLYQSPMAAARLLLLVFFLMTMAAEATHSSTSPLLLSQILSHLGFHEFSLAAAHTLSMTSPFPAVAATPTTIFAPSDAALASCTASFCSLPLLLPLHTVPFLLSSSDLHLLPFSTNLQTLNPLHCLSVTSSSTSKVLINGISISHPDLFNDGLTVVHGLEAVFPPTLCSTTSPPVVTNFNLSLTIPLTHPLPPRLLMSFMLHDAIFRLRHSGYGVLSLAIKVRFEDLLDLANATVFAVDDSTIFTSEDDESAADSYRDRDFAGNVRLHVLPNRYVAKDELMMLPVGTTMRTLKEGQDLVVTSAGGPTADVEINYTRVKSPEVVRNLKVMVHGLSLPFAKVRVEPGVPNPTISGPAVNRTIEVDGPGAREWKGDCGPGRSTTIEVEDYHGP